MIWSIAWKNVWRNRKRSLVVIVAVTLGIISGVLLVGVMEGWTKQRLHDAIYNEVSHVQIHNEEYIKNEEIDRTILNYDAVTRHIDSLENMTAWTARTRIIAMANTPWASSGVIIYGIDPLREQRITEIHKVIVPGGGSYLEPDKEGSILISDKAAELLKLKHFIIADSTIEKLRNQKVPEFILDRLIPIKDRRFRSPKDFNVALKNVLSNKEFRRYAALISSGSLDYRLRSKIQITISDREGNPVQGVFRVCGIYRTTNAGFDQLAVFVNATELAALYGSKEILIHEIAILLDDIDHANDVKEKLSAVSPGNAVRTWRELAPDAAMMSDYMILYYVMFMGIIMLALAFGIINTMLMAILERTKELGMLMAIGMNRKRVFRMIMLETVFLTSVGAISGMVLGYVITSVLGKTGIYFAGWGEGFEAIGFAAKVYPLVTVNFVVFVTIIVILTAIISSLWPARKALKLNPVEALRTE